MHVVSEDVQEDRQGNDKEGEEVENLRKTRKPSRRDALTKKLLNYDQVSINWIQTSLKKVLCKIEACILTSAV